MQQTFDDSAPFVVAYVINRYPATSHSFIRREITALETKGVVVERFSIRNAEDLVDPLDEAEARKTCFILQQGTFFLMRSTVVRLLKRPLSFLSTLGTAIRTGLGSKQGMLRHLAYLIEASDIAWKAEAANVRHVHAHFATNSTDVALYVHKLTGIPFSFTLHGSDEVDQQLALRVPEKISQAKAAIVVSDYARAQLIRWAAPEDWSKISVVRCGLDFDEFSGGAAAAPNNHRLISIGRLVPQKGQLILIEAARQLRDAGASFELELIGDGELREAIEERIRQYNLENQVKLLGWQTNAQVIEHLQDARALVLPSVAEGLPVVIMEALALGCPVISTFIAGIPELVTPDCGWLVPAGNASALADVMQTVLGASAGQLTNMGIAGARRAREMHDIRVESAKLLQIFKNGLAT